MTAAPAVLRNELRWRWRALRENTQQLVALLVVALVLSLSLFGVVLGAYFLGRGVAGGDTLPLALGRVVAAGLVGLLTLLVTFRVVQVSGMPRHPDGLLLAAPSRDVLAALMGVEWLLYGGFVLVPGGLAAVALAVGAGAPLAGLTLALTLVCVVTLAVTLGFVLGLAVRVAIARSELLARYKTVIGVVLLLAYLSVFYSQRAQSALAPLVDALAATPFAWYGDLALSGLVAVPMGSLVGAIALTLAGIPTAFLVALWLARALWFSTPVQPEASEEASTMRSTGVVSRPVESYVRKTWTRARRSPLRLIFVAYPLLVFLGPLSESFSGDVPAVLVPMVAVYGAWATGAAFTLNPLGDEGPVLPVTLTAPVTGRTLVGAACLAGIAPGLPVTLLAVAVLGWLAGYAPLALLAVTLLAVIATLAAPALAAGIGVSFPRFEPVSNRGREVMIPSVIAFGIYSVLLLLASVPGLVLAIGPVQRFVANLLGVAALAVLGAGVVASAIGLLGAGALGFRHAARRFDGFTYD